MKEANKRKYKPGVLLDGSGRVATVNIMDGCTCSACSADQIQV
jgi:hypothetical protein